MSYNQSRPDRSEAQYRRRSSGYHQQQQQQQPQQQQQHRSSTAGYGRGAGPAPSTSVDPSLSSNRSSFKKPGNAQGGQQPPRVNLPPVNHSISKDGLLPNNHNVQSRSQGRGEPVLGGTPSPAESFTRSSGAIPKAPTSQSPAVSSKSNETANPAKVMQTKRQRPDSWPASN